MVDRCSDYPVRGIRISDDVKGEKQWSIGKRG